MPKIDMPKKDSDKDAVKNVDMPKNDVEEPEASEESEFNPSSTEKPGVLSRDGRSGQK